MRFTRSYCRNVDWADFALQVRLARSRLCIPFPNAPLACYKNNIWEEYLLISVSRRETGSRHSSTRDIVPARLGTHSVYPTPPVHHRQMGHRRPHHAVHRRPLAPARSRAPVTPRRAAPPLTANPPPQAHTRSRHHSSPTQAE